MLPLHRVLPAAGQDFGDFRYDYSWLYPDRVLRDLPWHSRQGRLPRGRDLLALPGFLQRGLPAPRPVIRWIPGVPVAVLAPMPRAAALG